MTESLLDLLLSSSSGVDRLGPLLALTQQSATPSMAGSGVGPVGPTGGSSDWERRARRMALNQYGYTRPEWQKLDSIIEQESGWNPSAYNEGSGAAGIAQNIRGFSEDYSQNDPIEQLRWLFNYINTHNYAGYGTGINAAYAHKQDTGWY